MLYVGYFCYLLQGEYKNFVDKRLLYLIEGDPDTPVQGRFVYLHNIAFCLCAYIIFKYILIMYGIPTHR